jgi:hypothetical protein
MNHGNIGLVETVFQEKSFNLSQAIRRVLGPTVRATLNGRIKSLSQVPQGERTLAEACHKSDKRVIVEIAHFCG